MVGHLSGLLEKVSKLCVRYRSNRTVGHLLFTSVETPDQPFIKEICAGLERQLSDLR